MITAKKAGQLTSMGLFDRQIERQLDDWLKTVPEPGQLAIILGGTASALSVARSLGRRGLSVLMLNTERYLGTFTRYARFVQLPPVQDFPDLWLEIFAYLGKQLGAGTPMFVTTDAHTRFVAQHQASLQRCFHFVIANAETIERILDKRLQYTFAKSIGVPVPQTYFPQSLEEAQEFAEQLRYPCLLKPYESNEGSQFLGKKKVLEVASPTELLVAYKRITSGGARLMLQEIVEGEDSDIYAYTAFWTADQQEAAWVTMRKLRQFPPRYGNGTLLTTVEAPEVTELSRKLLEGLKYRGYVGVEFKRNPRDKTFYLIEINPRAESFHQLAAEAGVDLTEVGYQCLTRVERKTHPSRFRAEVRFVNEEGDLHACAALRKLGKISFIGWLTSVQDAKAAITAWDDPAPLLVGLGRFMNTIWQTATAQLSGSFAPSR